VETAREDVGAVMEAAGGPEERTPFIELFTSPSFTVSDLEHAADEMDYIREEIQGIAFEAIVDVHDVLTAEQLEDLAGMAEENSFGMGRGPEMGRGSRTGHMLMR